MHSALIVVEVPDNKKKWRAFMDDIDRPEAGPLHKSRGVERLSKNVWLVNFRENTEPLARLISAATQHLFQLARISPRRAGQEHDFSVGTRKRTAFLAPARRSAAAVR